MSVAQVCGYVLVAFLGLLGFTVLVWIWQEKIDLSDLVNEANGQASMSRFQLLIFTFVIAVSLFEVVENRTTTFPEIPSGILTLLGISASTYAVSKGISYSQPGVIMGTWKRKGEDSQNVADAQAAAEAAEQHATSPKSMRIPRRKMRTQRRNRQIPRKVTPTMPNRQQGKRLTTRRS